jgi:hypothetical protein
MSRLGTYACAALTFASLASASLVLASGIGPAASAAEECSQRYKSCNGGCDRPIGAVDKVEVCKSRCDLRLIACDRQRANASTQGGRYFPQSLPAAGNDGLYPVIDDGNER